MKKYQVKLRQKRKLMSTCTCTLQCIVFNKVSCGWCCEFESRSGRGVQHYVIKFVSDLGQVGGFLRVLRFPLPIK
jgi:hypothetical protein